MTIDPVEDPSSREFTLFNGQNIYGSGYNIIIGQNTSVFRQGDKLNLRSPGYVFVPPVNSSIALVSQGNFISS